MNDLELYAEIGKWLNRYHRRDWYYTGLLKDFQHDLWILLRGRPINISYVKKRAFHYPVCTALSKYFNYSRTNGMREVVMLDDQGEYIDFAGTSEPMFELPVKKKTRPTHNYKKPKPIRVTYVNGVVEQFNGIPDLAESIGLDKNSLYRLIGKPLQSKRPTFRISHIRLIEYV